MSEVLSLENLVVATMLVIAVASDLKSKKVSNQIVVAMLFIGIATQCILHGSAGLGLAAASFFTALIVCLPLYLMKIFGGGDFKLLLAIAPLLNWKAVVIVVFTALIWGAVLGVLRALLGGDGKNLVKNTVGLLLLKTKPQTSQLHMIPFTVAFFFGFLSFLTLAQVGWELL